MSLKSFFNNAGAAIHRFWEDQEIKSLERQKTTAKAGFSMVAARGGAIFVPIAPSIAADIIEHCDKRLAAISEKRALAATPKI